MKSNKTAALHLTEAECQATFRALIEYRRILKLSEIKDSMLVNSEISAVDSISEKLSLAYFYPEKDYAA